MIDLFWNQMIATRVCGVCDDAVTTQNTHTEYFGLLNENFSILIVEYDFI